jgi:hypothetical protein
MAEARQQFIIALGGSGIAILRRIDELLIEHSGAGNRADGVRFSSLHVDWDCHLADPTRTVCGLPDHHVFGVPRGAAPSGEADMGPADRSMSEGGGRTHRFPRHEAVERVRTALLDEIERIGASTCNGTPCGGRIRLPYLR